MANIDSNPVTHHPVWNVYDEYRTTRLNVYYRERQINRLQKTNLIVEIIIAISVSSGVGGLWLWQTNGGDIIWKSIVTLAAFLSVIKPFLKFTEQIKQKSEILTRWRLLDTDFKLLKIEIEEQKSYGIDLQNRFHSLINIKKSIIESEPAEIIDRKLRKTCEDQVNEELPISYFFTPEV